MVLIRGNTFPVKDQLKALGGRWDAAERAWLVPSENERQARSIVPPWPAATHPGYHPKDTSIAEELHDTYMLYRDEDPRYPDGEDY